MGELHSPPLTSSQMPEEEAFCVFVRLMQEYRLRELFKPSMAELGLCIYQFEYLLQVKRKRESMNECKACGQGSSAVWKMMAFDSSNFKVWISMEK